MEKRKWSMTGVVGHILRVHRSKRLLNKQFRFLDLSVSHFGGANKILETDFLPSQGGLVAITPGALVALRMVLAKDV